VSSAACFIPYLPGETVRAFADVDYLKTPPGGGLSKNFRFAVSARGSLTAAQPPAIVDGLVSPITPRTNPVKPATPLDATGAPRGPGRPVDADLGSRRREQILEAAAQLFAEVGFDGADTQILADRLEVGKGTLYRYFPSKRDLFLATVDRVMRRLRETVDGEIADIADPLDRVSGAVRAYLDFFASNPGFVELLIQERAHFKDRKKPTYFEHRDANVERWREIFRGLIRAGRVRAIPVERITDVLSDLVYGTMFTNYFAGQPKSSEAQAMELLDIVFHGILVPSGSRPGGERRKVRH
jgi:AcrR family transcriptional regulator